MPERLIINGRGDEKVVYLRPDVAISQQTKTPKPFNEYLDDMQAVQEIVNKANPWQEEVTVPIKCDSEWYAVRPLADLHLGGGGVDYDKVKELLASLTTFSNIGTILVGDLCDFFIPTGKIANGMTGQVANPQTQWFALKSFLTTYQDRILGMTDDPSHVNWVYQATGVDPYTTICDDLKIPLVNQGGLVRLDFGAVSYDIVPFHNIAKFKSSFNLTHAHKRVLELHRDADVVISGHIHHSTYESAVRNGHEVSLLQLGTTKTSDSWGARQGFLGRPDSGYPILLLNTRHKAMEIVKTVEAAEKFLCN